MSSVSVAGGTLSIRVSASVNQYSVDNETWTAYSPPLTVSNTSINNTKLVVLVENGTQFTSPFQYFICASENIQFGSTSSVSTITLSNITNYPGLIDNGSVSNGFDIEVYNLKVISSSSTIAGGAGWIGANNFSRNATSYIINCHSTGNIPSQCGGIVGNNAAEGGSITIIGCSSSGAISSGSGGIVAQQANTVSCISCWSTGNIASYGGGIFGEFSGQTAGSISSARDCFSTGTLHSDAGGIFGGYAGNWIVNNDGLTSAINCYSRGGIPGSGGIYGPTVKRGTMTNCYCVGTTALYKSADLGSTIESGSINNYATLVWNTVSADAALSGTPGPNGVGTSWINTGTNTPYLLRNMGYSPYTSNIIESLELVSTYSTSLYGSESTIFGPNGTYQIINTEPTITINSNVGAITTTLATTAGLYSLIVLTQADNSGYSVSEVSLTVRSQMYGTGSVHLRQQGEDIEYSYDLETWNTITVWPVGIRNMDTSIFKVLFDTDITLVTTDQYFVPRSDYIQIGNTSLNTDGSIPVITIHDVSNYPGLIRNGSEGSVIAGRQYIYVFNLRVNATGTTTLAEGGGWLAQTYYARAADFNCFVNCHSDGDISNNGGGIVGSHSASFGDSPVLRLISCSSSGSIGQYGGGITGYRSNITICSGCWSTGSIGESAGGIIGSTVFRSVTVEGCYSTGTRSGSNAGGIMGHNISYDSENLINRCYSLGTGGVGIGVVGSGSKFTVTNCYCLNESLGSGVGASVNNYAANGNWSDITASASLSGAPVGGSVGTHWVSLAANQPYELRVMGYSPYLLEIIDYADNGVPYLVSASISSYVGGPSVAAINPNSTHLLLSLTGPTEDHQITMDTATGVFTVRPETPKGEYQAVVRSTGSYHITEFTLTVQDDPTVPCLLYGTKVLTPHGYQRVEDLTQGDYVMTGGRTIRIRNIYCTHVIGDRYTCPTLIPRGSIAKSYPPADIRISQSHLIKYQETWVNPGYYPVDLSYMGQKIVYYHIQLPDYCNDHLTIDNGVVVESLGSSKQDFAEYERRIYASIAYQASASKDMTFDFYSGSGA